jgi:hypothetical protein
MASCTASGIADWVETTTGGAVELGPGTLYRSLKEMVEDDLIREASAPDAAADPRRKYYAITATGRRRVKAEAARLENLVEVARARRLLPGAGVVSRPDVIVRPACAPVPATPARLSVRVPRGVRRGDDEVLR